MARYIENTEWFSSISQTAKQLINDGVWFLFKVASREKPEYAFMLVADYQFYMLDSDGSIIEKLDSRPTNITTEDMIYFEYLKRPISLSNACG